jgi:hypothetical protein
MWQLTKKKQRNSTRFYESAASPQGSAERVILEMLFILLLIASNFNGCRVVGGV